MTHEDKRIVWILGAGFSRSLGGLLLEELFSQRAHAEFKASFQDLSDDNWSRVFSLFWQHKKNAEFRGGLALWQHAEEFLEYLDMAATDKENNVRASVLRSVSGEADLKTLAMAGKQALAGQCCFANDVNLGSEAGPPEAWQPYVRWGSSLSPRDSIITFNYDLVLERLGTNRAVKLMGSESVAGVQESIPAGCTPIYKLHGSIDWMKLNDGFVRLEPEKLLREPDKLMLATPGPSKKIACQQHFEKLWTDALEAIKNANTLVFVGYRFPPTDTESLRRIVEALADNQVAEISVHTVLGPRTREDDTVRMEALLRDTLLGRGRRSQLGIRLEQDIVTKRQSLRNFTMTVHPLYAQDFFIVFERERLFVADQAAHDAVQATRAHRAG